MTTFFVNKNQVNNDTIYVDDKEDYSHLKHVLRLKTGEIIHICDNEQNRYEVKLESYDDSKKRANFRIIGKVDINTETRVKFDLYQGLPKAEKMELIIQKCTELGINSVFPVAMERCVVKLNAKNADNKLDRWNKIAKESAKQSGRQKIPTINRVINLKNMIENIGKYDIVLLPYENEHGITIKQAISDFKESVKDIKNIAIIIGPEGGFSSSEVELLSSCPNVHTVSLGNRILRTETAGIATVSMLIYDFEL